MEGYTTENEQLDALRRFFAENGKALIVGAVLGVGALVGWRYWQGQQAAAVQASSALYQQTTEALVAGQQDSAASAEAFVQGHSNVYAVLAALQLAQHFVEQGNIAQAEQQLLLAQQKSSDTNLSALVHLRLARVQLQEKKMDDALQTLDKVTDAGWMAMAEEIRGDILAAKNDRQGAREAYSKALAATPPQAQQELLRMKLNDLAS